MGETCKGGQAPWRRAFPGIAPQTAHAGRTPTPAPAARTAGFQATGVGGPRDSASLPTDVSIADGWERHRVTAVYSGGAIL